jgi:hypothetical protein
VASSLLLLGFFVAAGGTVFFGLKSWEAEKDVRKRMTAAGLTWSPRRSPPSGVR